MSILVSGVSGWLGQAFLRVIQDKSISLDINQIVGLTSNPRNRAAPQHVPYEDYYEFRPPNTLSGFVHLAFLTRDKIREMPLDEYIFSNRKIINRATEIIRSTKPKWVALVSSGAIFSKSSDFVEPEFDLLANPYGFLKLEEEEEISKAAADVGANLAIGRLWGATGVDLKPSPKYAISDFIQAALTKKNIVIHSENMVFRRYCDASEFMRVLVNCAMKDEFRIFNSGGPLVEMGDLAMTIADQIDHCGIERGTLSDFAPDRYFPKDHSYEEAASELGILPLSIKAQVALTILGHSQNGHHD
jgi:nucleoside-diphosphate-sugar epimerase